MQKVLPKMCQSLIPQISNCQARTHIHNYSNSFHSFYSKFTPPHYIYDVYIDGIRHPFMQNKTLYSPIALSGQLITITLSIMTRLTTSQRKTLYLLYLLIHIQRLFDVNTMNAQTDS